MHVDWFKIMFPQLDIMLAQAKIIYILIIKVLVSYFSFFHPWYFLIEIEKSSTMFLSSYRNTLESLRELKKLWKHSPNGSCSQSVSGFPKLSLVLQIHTRETQYMFSIP